MSGDERKEMERVGGFPGGKKTTIKCWELKKWVGKIRNFYDYMDLHINRLPRLLELTFAS